MKYVCKKLIMKNKFLFTFSVKKYFYKETVAASYKAKYCFNSLLYLKENNVMFARMKFYLFHFPTFTSSLHVY